MSEILERWASEDISARDFRNRFNSRNLSSAAMDTPEYQSRAYRRTGVAPSQGSVGTGAATNAAQFDAATKLAGISVMAQLERDERARQLATMAQVKSVFSTTIGDGQSVPKVSALKYAEDNRQAQIEALKNNDFEAYRKAQENWSNFKRTMPEYVKSVEAAAKSGLPGTQRLAGLTDGGFKLRLIKEEGINPDVYQNPAFPEYYRSTKKASVRYSEACAQAFNDPMKMSIRNQGLIAARSVMDHLTAAEQDEVIDLGDTVLSQSVGKQLLHGFRPTQTADGKPVEATEDDVRKGTELVYRAVADVFSTVGGDVTKTRKILNGFFPLAVEGAMKEGRASDPNNDVALYSMGSKAVVDKMRTFVPVFNRLLTSRADAVDLVSKALTDPALKTQFLDNPEKVSKAIVMAEIAKSQVVADGVRKGEDARLTEIKADIVTESVYKGEGVQGVGGTDDQDKRTKRERANMQMTFDAKAHEAGNSGDGVGFMVNKFEAIRKEGDGVDLPDDEVLALFNKRTGYNVSRDMYKFLKTEGQASAASTEIGKLISGALEMFSKDPRLADMVEVKEDPTTGKSTYRLRLTDAAAAAWLSAEPAPSKSGTPSSGLRSLEERTERDIGTWGRMKIIKEAMGAITGASNLKSALDTTVLVGSAPVMVRDLLPANDPDVMAALELVTDQGLLAHVKSASMYVPFVGTYAAGESIAMQHTLMQALGQTLKTRLGYSETEKRHYIAPEKTGPAAKAFDPAGQPFQRVRLNGFGEVEISRKELRRDPVLQMKVNASQKWSTLSDKEQKGIKTLIQTIKDRKNEAERVVTDYTPEQRAQYLNEINKIKRTASGSLQLEGILGQTDHFKTPADYRADVRLKLAVDGREIQQAEAVTNRDRQARADGAKVVGRVLADRKALPEEQENAAAWQQLVKGLPVGAPIPDAYEFIYRKRERVGAPNEQTQK